MAVAPKHQISLGVTENGRWAAFTERAPYFYFEASTEEDATSIAKRALDFYFGVEGRIGPVCPKILPLLSRIKRRGVVERCR